MDAATFVAFLRDIVIIVAAVLGTVVLLVIGVVAYETYRKVRAILDSVGRVTRNVEEGSDLVMGKLVRPMAKSAGVSFGIGRAVGFLLGIRSRKRGRKDG